MTQRQLASANGLTTITKDKDVVEDGATRSSDVSGHAVRHRPSGRRWPVCHSTMRLLDRQETMRTNGALCTARTRVVRLRATCACVCIDVRASSDQREYPHSTGHGTGGSGGGRTGRRGAAGQESEKGRPNEGEARARQRDAWTLTWTHGPWHGGRTKKIDPDETPNLSR